MPPKTPKDKTEPTGSSGLFAERDALQGRKQGVDAAAIDARLLYWVVMLLADRKASIQIGVTRDGGAWAVQYWDGKYPVKEYFSDEGELNRSWAALLRAGYGKDVAPEIDKVLREYGW
uniref:Uncharacterized protein n=1 Tax=uncultured prokaryote TaxID=198431 RepID=A0A0H5PZU2_9ZZZZ|nr:hypothetical protein [uncultured prokaryote]